MNRSPQDDENLTRLVREGLRPSGFWNRIDLAFRKLSGELPHGIDAPNKPLRKWIGASHELLEVIRFALIGVFLVPCGLLFLYFGLLGDLEPTMLAIGAIATAIGLLSLRSARHSFHRLRTISRA